MTRAAVNLGTGLGAFRFVAECDRRPDEVSLDLRVVEPQLALPPGMAVLTCRAVVLRVTTSVEVAAIRWSCESPPALAGSPRSGEHLDAQEWESDGRLVVVGTEDRECLASRLGFLRFDPDESSILYSPQTVEVEVPRVPKAATFGLHFVLAENRWPEPVEASAWFAVDIPHQSLAALTAT